MRDESEGRLIALGKFSFSFKSNYKWSLVNTLVTTPG